jgi:hypothetical protein
MLNWSLHQQAQRPIGPWSRALIGGVQPYMVGGPPSHYAILKGWGPATQGTRFTTATVPTYKPYSDSRECVASDGKHHWSSPAATATVLHHRTPLRHLLFPNRRCPCADPHHRTIDGRILLQTLGWSVTHPLNSLWLSSSFSGTSRMQVNYPARSTLVNLRVLTVATTRIV